jgi:decaprenylphospho-beta-D-erythro-pentofuranosid-2-ulose 2-reductase
MNILILGATSSIARATAAILAARGDQLYLASRDTEELTRIAADLNIRYKVAVEHASFDAEDIAAHKNFWQDMLTKIQNIDGVIFATGYLSDPAAATTEFQKIIASNFTGAVSILNLAADYFAAKKQGFILGISSIAGDRGRRSHYIYAAAKAGFTTYLQGLRCRLFADNVRVITIKPGYVDTAMTFGFTHMFLVATPNYVARRIVRAIDTTTEVKYIPWFWRILMLIIKLIPERIFKRLKI